jgi:hypothetical protein
MDRSAACCIAGKRRSGTRRLATIVWALFLLGFAGSCRNIDRTSRNESELLLSGIPVAQGADDNVKQSYTLNHYGEFRVNAVSEKTLGYLGANLAPLGPKAAERLGMEPYTGLLVQTVRVAGPAWQAGIRVNDVIISYEGDDIAGKDRLDYLTERTQPGTALEMGIVRKGESLSVSLKVGSETVVDKAQVFSAKLPVLDDRNRTGMRLAEITGEVREYILGIEAKETGLLLLENVPGGPAFFADFRIRDCILAVDELPVPALKEYSQALADKSPGDWVKVTLLRDGVTLHKDLRISEDELASGGFNALGIVKNRRGVGSRKFGLLLNLLFNSEVYYSVRKEEGYPENSRQSRWGAVLNLLAWSSTAKSKELRLLWLFPLGSYED